MKTILLFHLGILFTIGSINCQVKENLNELSESLTLKKDTSDQRFKHFYRSCSYSFEIIEDTLNVEYQHIAESKSKNEKEHFLNSDQVLQKMFLGDIDTIELKISNSSSTEGLLGCMPEEPRIQICAQRHYSLFKYWQLSFRNNEPATSNVEKKSSCCYIPIYKLADTTKFKKIINIIKKEAEEHFVEIPPNCKFQNVGIDPKFEVIHLNSLDISPRLNHTSDVGRSLNLLVQNYIQKHDINRLEGYIIIDTNNQIKHIDIDQEKLKEHWIEKDYFKSRKPPTRIWGPYISSTQFKEFKELIHNQNWISAKCNGENVMTFVRFSAYLKN